MSIVALLNESIPHVAASLLTHLMATGWAANQITATHSFRSEFNRVITNGACSGVSLLPNYWERRGTAEIVVTAINAVALIVSAFLSWKLVKVCIALSLMVVSIHLKYHSHSPLDGRLSNVLGPR
jgi:hypothetical protein